MIFNNNIFRPCYNSLCNRSGFSSEGGVCWAQQQGEVVRLAEVERYCSVSVLDVCIHMVKSVLPSSWTHAGKISGVQSSDEPCLSLQQ